MCTASRTGTMPYSDTTTTRAPSRSASSISSPHSAVDLPQVRGDARIVRVGPELLQAVVEMRQVAQRERRPAAAPDMLRRPRDPARRFDVGARPPELEQRERAEQPVELVAQLRRLGVVVGDLAAVGGIHRPRRGAHVRRAVHVVPPEHVGAGEGRIAAPAGLPDLLARRPAGSTAATARPRPDRESTSRWRRRRGRAAAAPVSSVDWTVQVTAGSTVPSGRMPPRAASAARCGVCAPTSRGVSPTTSRTSV